MRKWIVVAVCIAVVVALMAIPPRPTTVGGWIHAALPAVAAYVWGSYRVHRLAKEKREDAEN